jgi:hypothetical protein
VRGCVSEMGVVGRNGGKWSGVFGRCFFFWLLVLGSRRGRGLEISVG